MGASSRCPNFRQEAHPSSEPLSLGQHPAGHSGPRIQLSDCGVSGLTRRLKEFPRKRKYFCRPREGPLAATARYEARCTAGTPDAHRLPRVDTAGLATSAPPICTSGAKYLTFLVFLTRTAGARGLHDSTRMAQKLDPRLRKASQRTDFEVRLREIAAQIEVDFEGRERERLRALVAEALERHIEIRESARRTRAALDKLRSDQHLLLRLFDFITASADRETIH